MELYIQDLLQRVELNRQKYRKYEIVKLKCFVNRLGNKLFNMF